MRSGVSSMKRILIVLVIATLFAGLVASSTPVFADVSQNPEDTLRIIDDICSRDPDLYKLCHDLWRVVVDENILVATLNWEWFERLSDSVYVLRLPEHLSYTDLDLAMYRVLLMLLKHTGSAPVEYWYYLTIVRDGDAWRIYDYRGREVREVSVSEADALMTARSKVSINDVFRVLSILNAHTAGVAGNYNILEIYFTTGNAGNQAVIELNPVDVLSRVKSIFGEKLVRENTRIALIEKANVAGLFANSTFISEFIEFREALKSKYLEAYRYNPVDLHLVVDLLGSIVTVSHDLLKKLAEVWNTSERSALAKLVDSILSLPSAPRIAPPDRLIVVVCAPYSIFVKVIEEEISGEPVSSKPSITTTSDRYEPVDSTLEKSGYAEQEQITNTTTSTLERGETAGTYVSGVGGSETTSIQDSVNETGRSRNALEHGAITLIVAIASIAVAAVITALTRSALRK